LFHVNSALRAFKWGSICASLFIIFLSPAYADKADTIRSVLESSEIKSLSASTGWLGLLHSNKKKSNILDSGFLLSGKKYSAAAEMKASIQYLYSSDERAVCRFPARYLWLQKKLGLPTLNLSRCTELIEFENRAPFDKVSLVFVSENISKPSTMMGHVLFKSSGTNSEGENVDHAISFYTTIEGFNIPKILYQSLASGKKGYFSLSPYSEKISRYNDKENRNVWEYELDIDEFDRKLINYHFYELKQSKLTYLFTTYNCATVVQFILNLTKDDIDRGNEYWTSPVDVVKNAEVLGLFKKVRLIPSNKWRMRMLSDVMSFESKHLTKMAIEKNNLAYVHSIPDESQKYAAYSLLSSYLESNTGDVESTARLSQLAKDLQTTQSNPRNYNINLYNYKSPTKSPNDSQISIGTSKHLGQNHIFVNLLAASHKLEDDNRQYFGETELTLGDITIATSEETGSAYIESFTMYGMKSLIPYDYFSGGVSGSFHLGMTQRKDFEWLNRSTYYVDGSLGITYGLSRDVSAYGLIGAGISTTTRGHTYNELTPEVGIIIKEIFDMKTIIKYQRSHTSSHLIPSHSSASLTQALYIKKDWAIFAKAELIKMEKRDEENFSFWVKHYF
jgi:Domain of unknown function (DUF4105)